MKTMTKKYLLRACGVNAFLISNNDLCKNRYCLLCIYSEFFIFIIILYIFFVIFQLFNISYFEVLSSVEGCIFRHADLQEGFVGNQENSYSGP